MDHICREPEILPTNVGRVTERWDDLNERTHDTCWGPIDVVAATGSTNADLIVGASRPQSPLSHGHVLIALRQDAGRGRFDRVWVAPEGATVAMSMLVEPGMPLTEWVWLSAAAGMAVRDAVVNVTGADPARVTLKWPNDAQLDGKKMCGILVEQVPAAPHLAVIGIGVNVSLAEDQLPTPVATSLRVAGLAAQRDDVAVEILRCLDAIVRRWQQSGSLIAEYRATLSTLGRPVRVILGQDHVVEGTAVDVDQHGSLVVELPSKERQAFAAGDVVHLR